ncbi:CBR-GUR-5 protein [Ditylenchus destructor]|nr:CBR-GUR-5 protein [Ditylenchus destructor]
MASVWLFGAARTTGANIERAIGQGIGILDPTMGLHRFDFVYRIIGFYEHLVINCTVCYFASSIRGLTIQLKEFNRDFQELFETPYKLDNLSGRIQSFFTTHKVLTQKVKVIDKTFKMFVFCILLTNVPMTVFGAITLVRRESLLAFVFALYDFVFCILQLTAFTIIPAQLYAELHMLPSYIDWASSIWTHFDPHLFQIAKAYIDNVDKLNVGVSFGGLALVLVVPYVILSYQLYVESSRSSQQYNIVTKALNRSSDHHPCDDELLQCELSEDWEELSFCDFRESDIGGLCSVTLKRSYIVNEDAENVTITENLANLFAGKIFESFGVKRMATFLDVNFNDKLAHSILVEAWNGIKIKQRFYVCGKYHLFTPEVVMQYERKYDSTEVVATEAVSTEAVPACVIPAEVVPAREKWIYNQNSNSCFWFSSKKENYSTSKDKCRKIGGQLANLDKVGLTDWIQHPCAEFRRASIRIDSPAA